MSESLELERDQFGFLGFLEHEQRDILVPFILNIIADEEIFLMKTDEDLRGLVNFKLIVPPRQQELS